MKKASISLHDLRRKTYLKGKADFGWDRWSRGWLYWFRKRCQSDRSHKPSGEAHRKAQCGKSARCV
jgi:hypothetical protein